MRTCFSFLAKTTRTRPPTYLWTALQSPVACLFTTIDLLWTQTVGGFTVGSHFAARLCDLYIHLCNTPLFCTYTCELFPPFDTKSQSSLSTTHLDPLCVPPFPLLFICTFNPFHFCIFSSLDPQAASRTGRLPGKGVRPDNATQCQCRWTQIHSSETALYSLLYLQGIINSPFCV